MGQKCPIEPKEPIERDSHIWPQITRQGTVYVGCRSKFAATQRRLQVDDLRQPEPCLFEAQTKGFRCPATIQIVPPHLEETARGRKFCGRPRTACQHFVAIVILIGLFGSRPRNKRRKCDNCLRGIPAGRGTAAEFADCLWRGRYIVGQARTAIALELANAGSRLRRRVQIVGCISSCDDDAATLLGGFGLVWLLWAPDPGAGILEVPKVAANFLHVFWPLCC